LWLINIFAYWMRIFIYASSTTKYIAIGERNSLFDELLYPVIWQSFDIVDLNLETGSCQLPVF